MPALHNSHFFPQNSVTKKLSDLHEEFWKFDCPLLYCFHFRVGRLATTSVSCLISSFHVTFTKRIVPTLMSVFLVGVFFLILCLRSSLGLCHHLPLCPYYLALIFINLSFPGLIVLPLSLLVHVQVSSPYINVSLWNTCKSETFAW
jgi:hypothetical protein